MEEAAEITAAPVNAAAKAKADKSTLEEVVDVEDDSSEPPVTKVKDKNGNLVPLVTLLEPGELSKHDKTTK